MAKLKLNDELIKKTKYYLSIGNYASTVCNLLLITEKTYYEWKKIGNEDIKKDKKTIYSEFCNAIKEAEAIAEIKALENIKKASKDGVWQADAWYLERKHPDKWSVKNRIEHSGDMGINIKVDWGKDGKEEDNDK